MSTQKMKNLYFNGAIQLSCDKFTLIALLAWMPAKCLAAETGKSNETAPIPKTITGDARAPLKEERAKENAKMSFRELIERVMLEGKDKPMSSPSVVELGFSKEVMSKAVRHKSKDSPDKQEHAFHVIYEQVKDRTSVPVAVIIMRTKLTERDG